MSENISSVKEFFKSPHIQLSLAVGSSIIILAIFSKKILPEPIPYLPQAFPPFLVAVYEALFKKYKDRKICTPWYWVVGIYVATAIVILAYAI